MALTPEQWQQYHSSYTCVTLPPNSHIELVETQQPECVQRTSIRAQHFWTGSQNDTLYALVQAPLINPTQVVGQLEVFPIKFSEFCYAKRNAPSDNQLDPQIKQALKGIQILCVASSLEIEGKYLTGIKARGSMQGFRELVPQGLVDHNLTLEQTIAKELQEETALDSQKNLLDAIPTHLHHSSLFGDCTIIYKLKATPQAVENIISSNEHEKLDLLTLEELKKVPKFEWNHASYLIAQYHQIITDD